MANRCLAPFGRALRDPRRQAERIPGWHRGRSAGRYERAAHPPPDGHHLRGGVHPARGGTRAPGDRARRQGAGPLRRPQAVASPSGPVRRCWNMGASSSRSRVRRHRGERLDQHDVARQRDADDLHADQDRTGRPAGRRRSPCVSRADVARRRSRAPAPPPPDAGWRSGSGPAMIRPRGRILERADDQLGQPPADLVARPVAPAPRARRRRPAAAASPRGRAPPSSRRSGRPAPGRRRRRRDDAERRAVVAELRELRLRAASTIASRVWVVPRRRPLRPAGVVDIVIPEVYSR